MDWHDRYYGVALQTITVFVEHLRNFEMSSREIFLMRHAFTFINYFIGTVFFYLILRRRFGDSFVPVVGVLFLILYPRFFGESFYNIKDILFFSWCIIASYFTLRWLEDERKHAFIIPAAITLAVATNTRILGISILMLACGFAFLQGIITKGALRHNIKKCIHLILLTFASYVVITPFTWENPIKNTIDTFFHFLWFQPWWGTHFYMGEMITREVPWHYIPVWMGVTVPLLYIVMFFVGFAAIIYVGIKHTKWHLYDLFFFAMFTCTLLGYILLRISMYEGWRHAYSIFLPFLYIAVYGLYRSYKFYSRSGKITKISFVGVVSGYLLYLLVWIVVYHPYQYVYFNLVGRRVAQQNFALDYWYVSNADLARYALNHTDEPFVTIAAGSFNHHFVYILTDEEQARFAFTCRDTADFYIRGSRLSYEWQRYYQGPDFRELATIEVDGMRIAALYQRVLPFTVDIDTAAWGNLVEFRSNGNYNFHHMNDSNPDTKWSTGRPQAAGDYLIFVFREAVNYNYIRLNNGRLRSDYPRGLAIYTSNNGYTWHNAPIAFNSAQSHYVFESEAYHFIKLVTTDYSPRYWWSIAEMSFGYALAN